MISKIKYSPEGNEEEPPFLRSQAPLTLAGWWRRAAAWLIDAMLVGPPLILVFIIAEIALESVSASAQEKNPGAWFAGFYESYIAGAVVVLIGVAVIVSLYCRSMSRKGDRSGQSLGKQILGIAVIRKGDKDISFWFIFVRQILLPAALIVATIITLTIATEILGSRDWNPFEFLAFIIITFTPCFVVYLWPLRDKHNQGIHDKIVKSYVVRIKKD